MRFYKSFIDCNKRRSRNNMVKYLTQVNGFVHLSHIGLRWISNVNLESKPQLFLKINLVEWDIIENYGGGGALPIFCNQLLFAITLKN